jgi:pentatricopeptide repeat protein
VWEHGRCLECVQQDAISKCGNLDCHTWRMCNACDAKEALKHFEQMCEEGVQPNDVTFVCLLSGCSHEGLVDEGMWCYASMVRVYDFCKFRTLHLYGQPSWLCWPSTGGREYGHGNALSTTCGCLDGLISACRIHGNVEMAERVAKQILELEPDNAAGYVLLSNIYAPAGNRHLCENVAWQRKEKGEKKQPGCTWIEVNNEVHTFVVDDQDHPQMIEIHAELQRLSGLMHDAGHVTCPKFVLHDVEEEKLFHLCHHSEKLAIAFGLINTAPSTPL